MNPDLPPELALLEAQLVQLFAQVDSGGLSPEQAQPALDALFVFDAAGNRWSVTPATRPPDTTFVVAGAGGAPQRAHPSTFVRPQPHPGAPDPRLDELMTPPPSQGPVLAGAPPFATGPAGAPAPGPAAAPAGPVAVDGPARPARPRPSLPALSSLLPDGPLGARGRLVAVGVVGVVLLGAFVALSGRGTTGTPATTTVPAGRCPAPATAFGGVPAPLAGYADCLAGAGEPSMLSPALGADQTGALVFVPDGQPRGDYLVYATSVLYTTAGGPAPDGTAPAGADLSQVPDDIRPGVAAALAAGLADPAMVTSKPLTRGQAEQMLAAVYAKLGRTRPAADPAPGDPLDASTYATMFGQALQQLAPAQGDERPSPAGPGGGAAPDRDAAAKVLDELQSGRTDRATKVVATPGDATEQVLQTAYFAGFRASGLKMTSTAPEAGGEGATSTVKVADQKGTVYATGTATWVRDGGTWRLAKWPPLTAAR